MAKNRALHDINKILEIHELTLSSFNLPKITKNILETTTELSKHEFKKQTEENNIFIKTLNKKQKRIFDEIIKIFKAKNTKEKFFFIDGPGGTGKTYLYKAIIKQFQNDKNTINTYATTGIAADLLDNAQTVHSGFGIPLSPTGTSTSTIKLTSNVAQNLKLTHAIIIDEVSMMFKYSLEIINKLLQEIIENKQLFGGKLLIIGGDFCQTANIILHGSNADVVENSIKNSFLWPLVKKRKLTKNMRSKTHEKYNK